MLSVCRNTSRPTSGLLEKKKDRLVGGDDPSVSGLQISGDHKRRPSD